MARWAWKFATKAESSPAARQLGAMVLEALGKNPLFLSAALPLHVFPPLFNRYTGGQSFGTHVDNAIRQVPGTGQRIRTDLSATLFFAGPDEYDGGELCIEETPWESASDALVEMATRSASTEHGDRPRTHLQVLVGADHLQRLCELASGTVIRPEDLADLRGHPAFPRPLLAHGAAQQHGHVAECGLGGLLQRGALMHFGRSKGGSEFFQLRLAQAIQPWRQWRLQRLGENIGFCGCHGVCLKKMPVIPRAAG